jgi:hypothetical protein
MNARNFRKFSKNTLVGFFDLFLDSGLILRGCTLHLSHERYWVGLPAKPYTKDGAETWASIVDFNGKNVRKKFQKEAVAAALAAFGEEAAA